MVPDEMDYCPFCGTDDLERDERTTPGPETYYSCPNCGRIGTTGVGRMPQQSAE